MRARTGAACGIVAALLAAAYGVPGTFIAELLGRLVPAPDLAGVLALALALAGIALALAGDAPALPGVSPALPGIAPALPAVGRMALPLRAGATLALLVAVVLVGPAAPLDLAPPAAFGLHTRIGLMLSLGTLAASLWPPSGPRWALAIQGALALSWAFCAAQLCLLIPARLLLDWMPLQGGLSWPLTAVMALLTAAATVRVHQHPVMQAFFAGREDRQIFAAHLAMLFTAVGLATLVIAGLLTVRTVEAMLPVLHRGVLGQASALDQLISRVADASDRAAGELWPALDQAVPDAAGVATPARRLQLLRQQLDPLGQVGISLRAATQAPAHEGPVHEGLWLPLPAQAGRDIALSHVDSLLVQVTRAAPNRPQDRLVIQVRPLQPEAQLAPMDLLGASATVLLCIDKQRPEAVCLSKSSPQGHRMALPARADGSAWPVQRAWRGESGVMLVRDPWGAAAAVAFAPVGRTGLGIVQKLPLAPLVQGLADTVMSVVLLLLLVMAGGAGWHWRRSFPVLRRLRDARAQQQSTLEHVPLGVLTLDGRGRISSSNAGADRLFGLTAAQLAGRDIRTLMSPADDGAAQPAAWPPVAGPSEAQVRATDGQRIPVQTLVEAFDFEGAQRQVLILRDLRSEQAHRAELERSEALLQLVLKSLPVGVLIADRDGRIVATNPAVDQLWCGPAPLQDGRPDCTRARRVVDGRPVARDDSPTQRAIRSGLASIGELIEIDCNDGNRRTLMASAVPLIGADGAIQGAIAVHEDLTVVRQAEAAIVAAKNFFESLFQSAAVGMAVWDAQGRVVRVNRALCELLCRDEAAMLSSTLRELSDPEFVDADLAMLARMRCGLPAKVQVERRLRRCDGRLVWVLMVVSLLRLPGDEQPQFVAQLLDIDSSRRTQQALRDSEARLRALSANEEALIEQERRHIAREVHDELGQALTALKLGLSLLGRKLADQPPLSGQVERLSAMVDDTLNVVRHVASNLRPAALDFGLVAAVEWLAEDFGHRWELPCVLQLDDCECRLDDSSATALFRIVQESLTNVARHARASRVDIAMRCNGATMNLTVQDNGIGFDTRQESGGSFGLLGMRERALKIGARLWIDSRAGAGTTVHVELPLQPPSP